MPGAGVVRAGVDPGQAVGHRVHRQEQFGTEVEPGEVVGHGTPYQINESQAQRGPHEDLGGLLDGPRFTQPGRGEVRPQRRDLGLHRVVGGDVLGGEGPLELLAGGRPVGAEQQVRARSRGRQEVVRIPAQHRDRQVERAQQFRWHQTEQVRAGGLAQLRHLRERPLGPGGPADRPVRLQHHDRQPGPGQQDRGDQAVVSGPDDDDVRAGRNLARAHGSSAYELPDKCFQLRL